VLRIVIPHELGSFYAFGQQGIPDGCRRPGEHDPRDAKWTTNPVAPFVNLGLVGVGQGEASRGISFIGRIPLGPPNVWVEFFKQPRMARTVRSTSTWSGMTRCHVEAVRHKTLRPIL